MARCCRQMERHARDLSHSLRQLASIFPSRFSWLRHYILTGFPNAPLTSPTMLLSIWSLALPLFALLELSLAQVSCENYGTVNGSSCACPPGFGGSTCSEPGCGGDIFQGSSRSLAQGNETIFSNLTGSSCSCESGWGGFGCNTCQSASACQTAFTKAGGSDSLTSSISGGNDTLVCNMEPTVFSAGQMSCSVIVRVSRQSE